MLLTGCSKDSEVTAQTMTQKLYITIDGKTLPVQLVDNEATQTLLTALQEGDITYEAHDYGGFEKVGALGRSEDQGDRSLIFFSKKFVNSHNKLYLCSRVAVGTGT